MYNVPRLTLHSRRAGIATRRDYEPKLKKLTKLKEEVIVRHILKLNLRGFAPTLDTVQGIADKLLAKHSTGHIGKQWPRNFVNQTDSLTTQFNRPYN